MKCGKSVQIDLDTQSKLLEVAKKHGLDLTSFNIGILDNEAAKENKRQTILQAMDLLRNIIINKGNICIKNSYNSILTSKHF